MPAVLCPVSPQRGFTLIELLVVMVIIGTLVSLTVLTTGRSGSSRQLRDEAQRMAALIGVLADEAVASGHEYGLLVNDDGYQVLTWQNPTATWVPLDKQPAKANSKDLHWVLSLDGEALKMPIPAKDHSAIDLRAAPGKKPLMPQVLILSNGELSPFELRLEERRSGGAIYQLVSDGYQLPVARPVGGKE